MRAYSSRLAQAAVAATIFGACSHSPAPGTRGANCIDLSRVLAARVSEQPAVSNLPRDVRTQLIDSLKATGDICLTAPTVGLNCNAGGARAPDVRRCCKFAQAPEATLAGVPRRIRIRQGSDPETPPAVDLEIQGLVADLALDQRCEVPTCAADRATARPQIDVIGRLATADGIVELELRIDLGESVDLTCNLPTSANAAS